MLVPVTNRATKSGSASMPLLQNPASSMHCRSMDQGSRFASKPMIACCRIPRNRSFDRQAVCDINPPCGLRDLSNSQGRICSRSCELGNTTTPHLSEVRFRLGSTAFSQNATVSLSRFTKRSPANPRLPSFASGQRKTKSPTFTWSFRHSLDVLGRVLGGQRGTRTPDFLLVRQAL